jgi:transposase-like protein
MGNCPAPQVDKRTSAFRDLQAPHSAVAGPTRYFRSYPRQFRDDVVRAARNREPDGGLDHIAKDFGIHFTTLYDWLKKADVEDG